MSDFTENPATPEQIMRIRKRLPSFIGEKRLNHTFFVEKEVIALAESLEMVYNITEQVSPFRACRKEGFPRPPPR